MFNYNPPPSSVYSIQYEHKLCALKDSYTRKLDNERIWLLLEKCVSPIACFADNLSLVLDVFSGTIVHLLQWHSTHTHTHSVRAITHTHTQCQGYHTSHITHPHPPTHTTPHTLTYSSGSPIVSALATLLRPPIPPTVGVNSRVVNKGLIAGWWTKG